MQVFMLFSLLNNKKNIVFSGDIHQIVNPTYFNFGRIENLFYNHGINRNEISDIKLVKNYRSQEKIIELSNKLSNIRKERIGNLGFDDFKEVSIRNGAKPFLLTYNDTNRLGFFNSLKERTYTIAIIPDEKTKDEFDEDIRNRLFTVQEAKELCNKWAEERLKKNAFKKPSIFERIFKRNRSSNKNKRTVLRAG